jgi:hypothetical protein
VYSRKPTYDPEDSISLSDVSDSPTFIQSDVDTAHQQALSSYLPSAVKTASTSNAPFAPFANATIYRLIHFWFGGPPMKTVAELDRLVNDILLQEDFSQYHLQGFRSTRELQRLDNHEPGNVPQLESAAKGWRESTVKIQVPSDYASKGNQVHAFEYEIPGVFHRSLTELIKEAFQDSIAQAFHFTPFKQFWRPSQDEPPVRLYGDLFSSDAMIEEHEKLCSQPSKLRLRIALAHLHLFRQPIEIRPCKAQFMCITPLCVHPSCESV